MLYFCHTLLYRNDIHGHFKFTLSDVNDCVKSDSHFEIIVIGCDKLTKVTVTKNGEVKQKKWRILYSFIQASLCKIQGLFKDFLKTFLLLSRTENF